jgi:hypothetical protein
MTTALDGGKGSASRSGRSLPPGKTRYPLYRKLVGPQGRSGQVRIILPPTGIRSPDRSARSQSPYRLSYPAHSYPVRSGIILRVQKKRMVPIVCSETSLRNQYYSLRNNAEERSSQLRRDGRLKSRIETCLGGKTDALVLSIIHWN